MSNKLTWHDRPHSADDRQRFATYNGRLAFLLDIKEDTNADEGVVTYYSLGTPQYSDRIYYTPSRNNLDDVLDVVERDAQKTWDEYFPIETLAVAQPSPSISTPSMTLTDLDSYLKDLVSPDLREALMREIKIKVGVS